MERATVRRMPQIKGGKLMVRKPSNKMRPNPPALMVAEPKESRSFSLDPSLGTLENIVVKNGQQVKSGDVIATYQNATIADQANEQAQSLNKLNLAITNAKTNLDSAVQKRNQLANQLAQAKKNVQSLQAANDPSAIEASAQLDAAQQAYDAQVEVVNQAQQALDNANLDFSDANAQVEQTRKKVTTSVTAPFVGTVSRYYQGSKNTASVTAVLDKGTKPDEVANKILDKLKKQGSLRNQGTYQSFDSSFLTKGIGKVLSTITYFISAVAGISLFIAGVGVMNMMYISVSERTKEIGIRRALGATQRSIMIQFLLEGVMLTFTGGIIGYLLGMVVAYSIGAIMKIGIQIDFFTISIAVGVSTLIGLVFSVMPAREAAKKDLIDILR